MICGGRGAGAINGQAGRLQGRPRQGCPANCGRSAHGAAGQPGVHTCSVGMSAHMRWPASISHLQQRAGSSLRVVARCAAAGAVSAEQGSSSSHARLLRQLKSVMQPSLTLCSHTSRCRMQRSACRLPCAPAPRAWRCHSCLRLQSRTSCESRARPRQLSDHILHRGQLSGAHAPHPPCCVPAATDHIMNPDCLHVPSLPVSTDVCSAPIMRLSPKSQSLAT